MSRTYTKNVSATELVTGIIGTFDISGTLGQIVRYTEDVKRAEAEYARLQNITRRISSTGLDEWRRIGLMSAEQIISMAGPRLNTAMSQIQTEIWNSLVNSAAGLGVTANIYSTIGKLLSQDLGLSFYFDAAISMIQEKTLEKISRYWNKSLEWNILGVKEATEAYRRGLITYDQYISIIQENTGLSLQHAQIYEKAQQQIPDVTSAFKMMMEGLINFEEFEKIVVANGYPKEYAAKWRDMLDREPDPAFAFELWRRGLITRGKFRECLRIAGYQDSWHEIIEKGLYRIPSLGDLIRISDYVELPHAYIEECMRQQGYTDTAIYYLVKAIARRPLREEVRSLTTLLNYNYYRGYISKEELSDAYNKIGLLPEEKTLNEIYASYRRAQYKFELMIDIIEQKTRKKIYTTIAEIENALVTIGVDQEIANLMATKWYYQYVYGD